MSRFVLRTGQTRCFDAAGRGLPCPVNGQDAAAGSGAPWPEPRFTVDGANPEAVRDALTGLEWTKNANPNEFPAAWTEALALIRTWNAEGRFGHDDWRLPNRRELRSLLSFAKTDPALPGGHPFENVFSGWYWTSTTAAVRPAYAWYVHLLGARMFYGRKNGDAMVWPVRGVSEVLAATGQTACFDADGKPVDCAGTGQDGETRHGAPWPEPRLIGDGSADDVVHDGLTGLIWTRSADLADGLTTWDGALRLVAALAEKDGRPWRLPTINELESLVDASRHTPALPEGHPFTDLRDGYWSSTTSALESDWAMCLYLHKGATGVGFKTGAEFHVWAVADQVA